MEKLKSCGHCLQSLQNTMNVPPNTMTFGKYAGKSFEFVKRNDVSYCNWVLQQYAFGGKMYPFQQWLKSKAKKITCECCNGSGLVDCM